MPSLTDSRRCRGLVVGDLVRETSGFPAREAPDLGLAPTRKPRSGVYPRLRSSAWIARRVLRKSDGPHPSVFQGPVCASTVPSRTSRSTSTTSTNLSSSMRVACEPTATPGPHRQRRRRPPTRPGQSHREGHDPSSCRSHMAGPHPHRRPVLRAKWKAGQRLGGVRLEAELLSCAPAESSNPRPRAEPRPAVRASAFRMREPRPEQKRIA